MLLLILINSFFISNVGFYIGKTSWSLIFYS